MQRITMPDFEQMFADIADAVNYLGFEYQGVSLGLFTDEASLLDWYSKFFGGYFVPTVNKDTDAQIFSTHDPAVFQRLRELATSGGRPRSKTETERVIDVRNTVIYSREVDEEKGKVDENCFILSQPGRKVLVAAPGALKDRQKTVKRSIRNMMKLLFIEQGWLPLHSATCVWNDTGIGILGGKYAGKTSTLINLLARPGAKLVSNDKLFLRDGGTYLEGCGFPNKAGLRFGTLAAYPHVVERIDKATDSFYPRLDAQAFRDIVATTPAAELGSKSERIEVLSTELAERLGIPIEHVAPIQLFLVVQFEPTLDESRLVPITDRNRIREHLSANIPRLSGEKQDFMQSFFDFDDATLQADFDALLDKFDSRVSVQELHQNARTNEHSAELVGHLPISK